MRAGAVSVDHGLQDGSAERAAQVVALLGGWGLDPAEAVSVEVGAGGGPEAAARDARYAALDARADKYDAAAVLLGHSRDDQAETVLLGLARGSGARSLAGMAPVAGRYRRPLLELERSRLAEACAAEGLVPWADPHNTDPAYARVRVRHEALPALERTLGPGVAAALARTAALLRADADALDALAAATDCTTPGKDALDCAKLAEQPQAIRTRILRSAAIAAGCPAGALSAGHVDSVDALVTAWHGQQGVDLPGRVHARRTCGILSFVAAPE